ncbi:hypothetical protein [Kluyvera genomosp. 1]|uniref:hypothetical protein n=1 Tax=Kluyvera genomosp. 1 TaxID=2774053 RepID=UPI0012E1EE91|nr:hypothetical protein [Kluyvera genomosp. 1]
MGTQPSGENVGNMKEEPTRNVVDEAFVRFFDTFHTVAEKSSGTLAIGIIQFLVMATSVIKRAQANGLMYWGLTFFAVVSTVGFFVSFFSIINVILKQNECEKWIKYLMILLYAPVYVGVMLSAISTYYSLN